MVSKDEMDRTICPTGCRWRASTRDGCTKLRCAPQSRNTRVNARVDPDLTVAQSVGTAVVRNVGAVAVAARATASTGRDETGSGVGASLLGRLVASGSGWLL